MRQQLQHSINVNGRLLDLSVPKVMGILNATPDSFFAGSRMQTEADIARRANEIIAQGGGGHGGVAISFAGIIYLILSRTDMGGGVAQTTPFGIFMIILNSLSFSLYLGIFKPVIQKYSVVTFMKWIFLFVHIPNYLFSGDTAHAR